MKILKKKSFTSVVFVFLVGLLIESSFPSYALACTILKDQVAPIPAPINVTSGATNIGSVLGGWSQPGRVRTGLTNCNANITILNRLMSAQPASRLTVNEGGITYDVYPTEINNIGYYVRVQDHAGNDLTLGDAYTRLDHVLRSINVWVRFVATGPLNPGTYSLSSRDFIWADTRSALNNAEIGRFDTDLSYSAGTVTVTALTCSVHAADRNQQVVLPTVSASNLQGVGSTAGSQGFTIGVNCPAGVALHATMTDVNSPANTSNILTLAQGSTATGVGLQISATDRAHVVSYGADSRVAGNNNQWFVGGNATSPPTNHIIPFTVRYVQTAAAVQPGTVRARSTITFSYQ